MLSAKKYPSSNNLSTKKKASKENIATSSPFISLKTMKRCKYRVSFRLHEIIFQQLYQQFIFDKILSTYYSRINDFTLEAINIHNRKLNLTELIRQFDGKIKEVTEREDFVDKLIDRFKSDGFYEWKGIRYFLFKYEIELKNKSKTKNQKINWHEYNNNLEDFISVEHIYPQKTDYDCWKKTFNIYKPRERKILNNSLGNLLPLSRPKNSSLQNKCFIDKVDNGKNSIGYRYGSYCENEITKYKEWTPNNILQRGLKLLYFMEKRWGLDFKNHEKRVELLNLKFVKEELNV